jgi:hypothetical protein
LQHFLSLNKSFFLSYLFDLFNKLCQSYFQSSRRCKNTNVNWAESVQLEITSNMSSNWIFNFNVILLQKSFFLSHVFIVQISLFECRLSRKIQNTNGNQTQFKNQFGQSECGLQLREITTKCSTSIWRRCLWYRCWKEKNIVCQSFFLIQLRAWSENHDFGQKWVKTNWRIQIF